MDCRFSNLSNATLYDDNHLTTEYSKCDWWKQHDNYTTDIFQLSATHTQTLTPTTHGTPIHNELDYMEFWNNNYYNYHSKTVNSTPNESQKTKESEHNELREVLNHVPALPRPLQRHEQEKKVKFIMIATSLDKTTILKKLDEALNKETCRAIPLSFTKESSCNNLGIPEDGIGKESDTVVAKPKETVKGQNEKRLEDSKLETSQNFKGNQTRVTQKEYFTKERNDNNRGISEDRIGKESNTVVPKPKETGNGYNKERVEHAGKQNSIRNLKRKQTRVTQKEYWKHGCSRNIVTVQMSCEETKSETTTCMKDERINEFEEENSELERQIKMLKTSELLQA